ncbi:N-acetylglucosamine-1-phosphodiester alpha-N-acetylglucosaminidase [Lingula anatina]|uniref:N-acetylglucosamine-1-phosphodiester alpha-N-acetylglucosaminidase n=1 Tax=Lingula anatina TaxID=7574 RepID=A0A1S3I2U3_LINAN|nr:N-acetylglucosamine-1-phosphodiester alpha-N-acetylglucosaminidase [Lingula anatina]|eukprot:XP_013392587.1 N-acetylglucosamine-1-phosphodiester alpha-N-acetylglucosaminidase [Lingula anatina]
MEADVHVHTSLLCYLILLLSAVLANIDSNTDTDLLDLLVPYQNLHGPRHSHRYVRDCQPYKYKNVTHETFKPTSAINSSKPLISVRQFVKSDDKHRYDFDRAHYIYGHYAVIQDPLRTFSVVEPGGPGGCMDDHWVRMTTKDSARTKNCVVAANAGFFNTTNGACLGNIISDGRLVQNSGGVQNAHFGIKKDGSLFIGYLPEYEVLHGDFQQLVGGVLWLLRDGESYLTESIAAECQDTEETGTLKTFAEVQSARTALGHDKEGNVVIVQAEGRTHHRGMNLYDFVEFLKSLGLVNAINLDGGGSATFIVNGSLSSYPSDKCPDNPTFGCERKVSTIVCAHEPECQPSHNCSGHGNCVGGICICDEYWMGPSCDLLMCGVHNCSRQGVCTESGCDCHKGWLGEQCNEPCTEHRYGYQCSEQCRCQNNATCSPVDGSCVCKPGYTGLLCTEKCPYGFFGESCKSLCYCEDSCSCNHITGECNITADVDADLFQDNPTFGCERKVSTIVCAHEPECQPSHNCSGHGNCVGGICICDEYWMGPSCDLLMCGVHNCSRQGVCTESGCDCHKGWLGEQCNEPCTEHRYGYQCSEQCRCQNNATCSPVDGSCVCKPGYTGLLCTEKCPYGFFGESCKSLCYCEDSCSCNHITGECNITADVDADLFQVGTCLAESRIRREHLVKDQSEQMSQLLLTVVILSILAATSITINISQVCFYAICKKTKTNNNKYHKLRRIPKDYYMDSEDGDDEEEMDEEEELDESITETSFLTGGSKFKHAPKS